MSADAGPAPVVTAAHIRPNCVLVYGRWSVRAGVRSSGFLWPRTASWGASAGG